MSADTQSTYDQLNGVLPPEQTSDVFGHDAVFDAIRQQINSGKLPGAILLHGPYGIGKASAAFALARDILIATGDEPEDRVREQIAAGAHPNVFVLRRRPRDTSGYYANIRVEDVRNIQQRMRQTRGRAGYRICVIDSIDDCNASAANALLKILEEPPAETLFIAVSHRPGSLLPTIRSRCHSYALRSLSDENMNSVLHQQMESLEVDEGAIACAIAVADGRPRRAFEALLLGDSSLLEQVQNWLGAPGEQPVAVHLDLANQIAAADAAAAGFARDLLIAWLAEEGRRAAQSGVRNRLASATQLWDKAQTLLADADSYNLDMRQTLVSIFDELRQHAIRYSALMPAG